MPRDWQGSTNRLSAAERGRVDEWDSSLGHEREGRLESGQTSPHGAEDARLWGRRSLHIVMLTCLETQNTHPLTQFPWGPFL